MRSSNESHIGVALYYVDCRAHSLRTLIVTAASRLVNSMITIELNYKIISKTPALAIIIANYPNNG